MIYKSKFSNSFEFLNNLLIAIIFYSKSNKNFLRAAQILKVGRISKNNSFWEHQKHFRDMKKYEKNRELLVSSLKVSFNPQVNNEIFSAQEESKNMAFTYSSHSNDDTKWWP